MSGPKGGSYVVVSAAELAARRLAAAEAAARAASSAIAELRARASTLAEVYRVEVTTELRDRPRTEDAEVLEAWTAEMQRAVSAAHAGLDSAVIKARSESVTAALDGLVETLTANLPTGDVTRVPTRRAAAPPKDAWRSTAAADAARVAGRLDAGCTDADVDVVGVLAAAVVDAKSVLSARQALDILRNDVSRRNHAHRTSVEREAKVEALLVQLDAWDHPATIALAASLRAGGGHASVEQLEVQAEAAVAAAVHDCDRAIVTRSIRKSLQAMGYSVEEGFDTLIAEQGFAHVRRATWTDHAVRVRLDGDRSEVGMVVVARNGVADAVRDVEVEREWCGSVPSLLEDLAVGGVDLDLDRRVDPGVLPVARLADGSFPFARAEEASRRSVPRAKAVDG